MNDVPGLPCQHDMEVESSTSCNTPPSELSHSNINIITNAIASGQLIPQVRHTVEIHTTKPSESVPKDTPISLHEAPRHAYIVSWDHNYCKDSSLKPVSPTKSA